MAEYPALPLWTDALIGDTYQLTPAEFGAYLRLLIAAWRSPDCSLPNNDARLGRMIGDPKGWRRLRPTVMAFWTLGEDGRWRQKRLLDERDWVARKTAQRVAAGKSSALKRKHRGSTTVAPPLQRNANETATPTPIPIKEETRGAENGPAKYAFQGSVIRLNQSDYDGWRQRFSAIPDFNAELANYDEYLAGPDGGDTKRWFHRAP
ncbi:MAG: DUF1376 domain-containing protein, partial [Geminicoccaceae bacterium]